MHNRTSNGLPKAVVFTRSGLIKEQVSMNPIDQALNNIQFPETLSHHDMSAYPPLRENPFRKPYLLGGNGHTLDITVTFFCKFSSIENTPMYLDALNLTQERIQ